MKASGHTPYGGNAAASSRPAGQGDQQRPAQPERRRVAIGPAAAGARVRGLVLRVGVGLPRYHLRRVNRMRARRESGGIARARRAAPTPGSDTARCRATRAI